MEASSLTAVQIILIVLAANAVLVLLAYGLVTWWQKQSRDAVQEIGARIREFDDQMVQLSGFLQAFAGIDQEPYFTPLEELQKEVSELGGSVQLFLDECRAFENEINTPELNQLQRIINAPFVWFRRWRQSARLKRESKAINAQVQAAEQRMEKIYELPWELAAECRKANQDAEEFGQHVQWLQAKGTRGISFQKIASQVAVMQQSLRGIPPAFLRSEKEELLNAANMQNTIQVFGTLHSLRPALDRYLPQVREWHAQLEKAGAEYTQLKQAGANLRQAIASPLAGIDITPLQERIDHVAQMATDLNQRLSQPDADQIKPLGRDVGHLRKVLEDTRQQYERAGQQVVELRKTLTELTDGINALVLQMNGLEHREAYPLAWDQSSPALNDLKQKTTALGPVQQLRTPEQITQQSSTLDALRGAYLQLGRAVPEAAGTHAKLVALLENPEIRDGAAWVRQSREMLSAAGAYDPKNWPKKEVLQALPGDLEEVSRLHNQAFPKDRSTPLKEAGLARQLEQAQELAAIHKRLRPMVESTRARLEKIQALEREGKERLTDAWSALEKVALLAESNELLDDITSDEIDSLGEEIRQLANELNAHAQGEIEKKAQRIEAGCARVTQALNQWVGKISSAAFEQAQQINERLVETASIASLDEPPVQDARKLVQREDISALLQHSTPAAQKAQGVVGRVATRISQLETKTSLANLEAVAELKRKNDLWQTLSAAHQALEESTGPLLAAHKEVIQARSEARERLAEVAKNYPEKRAWPPHNQLPLPESQALQQIEDNWDALRKRPGRAETAMIELSRLVQQYRLAGERAGQLLNRIQQDYERIQDLEWQVDSLKQRWQSQSDPSNAILREGIQQLVSQTDSRLSYIKQQYMRGTLTYEQAIQNLQLLYDEIFTAQVPVDEQSKIGLNETYRQPGKV